MQLRRTLPFLLLAAALSAQTVLRIGGGAAPMENIFKRIRGPFQEATGIQLELQDPGPDKAFLLLEKGELDAASAGLSLGAWFDLMAEKGHPVVDRGAYESVQIGVDRINVINHGDLFLLDLSRSQLKGIFTGQIRNWKELDGPDLPVVVVLGTKVPGTNKVFQEQIMDKAPFAPSARLVATTPDVMKAVAETPGAIAFGPISAIRDLKLLSPSTPEVGRPILLLTKGRPGPALLKLLDFIAGPGKAHIAK